MSRTVLLGGRTADTNLLSGLLAGQDSEPVIIEPTKLRVADVLVATCARAGGSRLRKALSQNASKRHGFSWTESYYSFAI